MSGSAPEAVFGKAITSRIESAPAQALDEAVEPVGDAAVRRRAVAQRLEQEAEALLGLLGRRSRARANTRRCTSRVGDTDRAAAELLAVPDDVVGERPGGAGVVGVELARGRGERVVQRVPALLVLVPLEQRPVDDPEEPLLAVGDQLEALGEVEPQLGRAPRSATGRLVGDDQQQVALLGAERLVQAASSSSERNFAVGERQPSPSRNAQTSPFAPSSWARSISPSSAERGSSRWPALSPLTTPPPIDHRRGRP